MPRKLCRNLLTINLGKHNMNQQYQTQMQTKQNLKQARKYNSKFIIRRHYFTFVSTGIKWLSNMPGNQKKLSKYLQITNKICRYNERRLLVIYPSAEYLPVTYSSSPSFLQPEWADRQIRSRHVKIPGLRHWQRGDDDASLCFCIRARCARRRFRYDWRFVDPILIMHSKIKNKQAKYCELRHCIEFSFSIPLFYSIVLHRYTNSYVLC